jgi:hypothetical protein
MPLVSIIMNVRNGAAFLREALDSVMAQTFADWELIVWDDCSTDDSAKIVGGYHDHRIRYFLSPDETPLGEARDRAIQQAAGEWLAFLDQDDIWLPRKLESQMALADHDDVGIIYGRTVLFDSRRGDLRDYDYAHEFQLLPEGNIFAALFRDACFIAMSSAVLRRSAVAEVGGIPDTIQVVPDYYLYIAIARRYQARAVQQVVCRYRVHPGSMSASHQHRLRLHAEPLSIVNQWAEFPGSSNRNLPPHDLLDCARVGGDAPPAHSADRPAKAAVGWLLALAHVATRCPGLASGSAKIMATLLAQARANQRLTLSVARTENCRPYAEPQRPRLVRH